VKPRTRRRVRLALGLLVTLGGLWLLWDSPLIFPLKLFVVFLHEVSHALAAVATGGRVEAILLSPRLGGACACPGGEPFLTLSAGYLGSVLWGVLLLESARLRTVPPGRLVQGVGVATLILSVWLVRGSFGLLFGITFGLALLLAPRGFSPQTNRGILQLLGLVSVLYALFDMKSDIFDRPHLPSDAYQLAGLTGIPLGVWGGLWMILAVGVALLSLRRALRDA